MSRMSMASSDALLRESHGTGRSNAGILPYGKRPEAGAPRVRGMLNLRASTHAREDSMAFSFSIGPVAALIAGILILLVPRLLNFIIALYLIVIGIVGLFGSPAGRSADATDTPPAAVHSIAPEPVG